MSRLTEHNRLHQNVVKLAETIHTKASDFNKEFSGHAKNSEWSVVTNKRGIFLNYCENRPASSYSKQYNLLKLPLLPAEELRHAIEAMDNISMQMHGKMPERNIKDLADRAEQLTKNINGDSK